MLAPITNNRITPVYNAVNFTFKGKCQTPVTKISNNIVKNASNKQPIALLFASLVSGIIGITGCKVDFDEDTGKLLRINEYKDGKLSKVKHFSSRLFRWEAIDEYQDGKIAKITHFYKRQGIPDWELIFKEDGNDIIREFYPNGKLKCYQYDINGSVDCKYHYDQDGKYLKYEKYNPNESLAYAILYGDNYDTVESYENNRLKYAEINFHSGNVFKRKIYYNENKEVTSVEELGKGYKTEYVYQNGRKKKSVTNYSNDEKFSRKETEYKNGDSPLLELFYGKDNFLCEKREYQDDNSRILTRYNVNGKVIYSEKLDTKNNKVTRKYGKK